MNTVIKKIGEQDDGVFDWMKVMEQQRIEREKERERDKERERARQAAAAEKAAAQQAAQAQAAAAQGTGSAVAASGTPVPGTPTQTPAAIAVPSSTVQTTTPQPTLDRSPAPATPGPERSLHASLGAPVHSASASASVQVLNGSTAPGATDAGSFAQSRRRGDAASGAGGSPITEDRAPASPVQATPTATPMQSSAAQARPNVPPKAKKSFLGGLCGCFGSD